MTFEALANAIRTRFRTEIQVPQSIVVQYDNFPRPIDKTNAEVNQPEGVWVKLAVEEGITAQASLGIGKRFRVPGVMRAMIHQPIGLGDQAPRAMFDKINAKFRAVTAAGVTYSTPTMNGTRTEGRWFILDVSCPFYADDVET